jgi:hypothetical protein
MEHTQEMIDKALEYADIFKEVAGMYDIQGDLNKSMEQKYGSMWFAYLLMAICSRESHFGLLLNDPDTGEITGEPDGVGDGGHGRGLMQIDDRWHIPFIQSGDWTDPFYNIDYAANLLTDNVMLVSRKKASYGLPGPQGAWQIAIAGYNCGMGNMAKVAKAGLDVDAKTTGRNYSKDVLARMNDLIEKGVLDG